MAGVRHILMRLCVSRHMRDLPEQAWIPYLQAVGNRYSPVRKEHVLPVAFVAAWAVALPVHRALGLPAPSAAGAAGYLGAMYLGFIGAWFMLLAKPVLLRAASGWLVRRHLRDSECPACAAPLAGARAAEGRPVCPSCGAGVDLLALEISEPPLLHRVWTICGTRFALDRKYREVPELDVFDDEEAARLYGDATAWGAVGLGFARALGIAAMFVIAFGGSVLTMLLVTAGFRAFFIRYPALEMTILAAAFSGWFFAGVAAWLRISSAATRRAVRARLGDDACPRCRYPLEGVPRIGRGVICPECGAVVPPRAT